jgi:hypothetical protein
MHSINVTIHVLLPKSSHFKFIWRKIRVSLLVYFYLTPNLVKDRFNSCTIEFN